MLYLFLGADQVAAAKICYAQAQEWVKLENSENAKSGKNKVFNFINVLKSNKIPSLCLF